MHPNEKVLRDADEAQVRGDAEAFIAAYTDDVIVHVPGNNQLSGVYKGKQQFAEVFQRFSELVPDYTFEPHAYFADDEHGVILQRSTWARGDEKIWTNDTFVCHFTDGKISEMWFQTDDDAAVDRFIG